MLHQKRVNLAADAAALAALSPALATARRRRGSSGIGGSGTGGAHASDRAAGAAYISERESAMRAAAAAAACIGAEHSVVGERAANYPPLSGTASELIEAAEAVAVSSETRWNGGGSTGGNTGMPNDAHDGRGVACISSDVNSGSVGDVPTSMDAPDPNPEAAQAIADATRYNCSIAAADAANTSGLPRLPVLAVQPAVVAIRRKRLGELSSLFELGPCTIMGRCD